jgi:hypothetical protein
MSNASDYIKFPAGTMDKGVNNFEPEIGAEISWTEDANNITSGIRRGVGPRYGMAPLAGHSNTETPTAGQCNGLQKSESTSATTSGLTFRQAIYGIVPITMAGYDGAWPKANQQFYAYLVGLTDSANLTLDVCLGATLASSVFKQSSTFVAGLADSSYRQESPLVRLHKTEMLNLPQGSTPTAADMQAILRQTFSSITGSQVNQFWAPWAHISVSGKRVPYQWMFANATSTPDATTAPNMNLWTKTLSIGNNPAVLGGSPSEIITREFPANNKRRLSVYCLDDDGYQVDMVYQKEITQDNTASIPAYGTGDNYITLTGATKSGASVAYSSVKCALINDPGSFTNTRHEAILVTGQVPYAVIYQDWLQATKGMMPRWIDLTDPGCTPRFLSNFSGTFAPSPRPSGNFTVASSPSSIYQIGETDTGILRTKTSYDIGFSFYNKLIDYETNVTYGLSLGNATEDNFCILYANAVTSDFNVWKQLITLTVNVPWEYSNDIPASGYPSGRGFHINDFEIRFYYRETGPGEWLPAGNYDAAQFWFYTRWAPTLYSPAATSYGPTLCQTAQGSLLGGRPNGFQDYSPLPKQQYICTQVFQQRAFWWSEKSMHFSNYNSIYAYATRNIVTCPTGKWRGGIVHIRQNAASQQARLVVFGDHTYSARFTGQTQTQNVRISETTVGQFEVDGSDFVMDYLCDSTAFSYRAAAVAEGILYFWGPQGVYLDDGAMPQPVKISGGLEPNIFDYVDMGRCSEIHSVYNKRTKEVIWFYPPKVTDSTHPTYLLVYNVKTQQFYPGKIRCQVDSSQNIKIENDDTPDGVDGERVLLHCRSTTAATVQRTFYFDDLVQAGEQGPGTELTVLSFTSPTTSTRKLTLATGSVGITAGGIVAGDYLSFNNSKGYAPSLTLAPDMIAKVTGVNNAAKTIDILLPTGATWDATATLTNQTAFPVYQRAAAAKGLHGILYDIPTNYWLPNGLSMAYYWQYLHFLFKYAGIPTPIDPLTIDADNPAGLSIISKFDLTYRTLVCDAALTDTIAFKNNADGFFQRHHQLRNEGRAANGQALAFALSGIYIGDPWTLQYMEAHCLEEKGFTLKEFER